jgi:uncharacterized protein (DUF1778 family)
VSLHADLLHVCDRGDPGARRGAWRVAGVQTDHRRGITVTDYIVESAFTQAQRDIREERDFALNSSQWKRFTAALDRTPKQKPELKKLLSEPSILENR